VPFPTIVIFEIFDKRDYPGPSRRSRPATEETPGSRRGHDIDVGGFPLHLCGEHTQPEIRIIRMGGKVKTLFRQPRAP
jgi:hypothetical protein